MNKQSQSVGTEGEAYQAGGNITINRSLSPEHMTEIMVALARQLQSYFAEAEHKAEARMKELREALIDEFVKPNTSGKTAAFSDPDYQFLLRDAHQSYARSGEESLRQELVRLLIQRSNELTGGRTALILNQAISIAGNLTREDYAALCGIFFFRYCKLTYSHPGHLIGGVSLIVISFAEDLPTDNHAYDYLESLALITINRLTSTTFNHILHANYANAFALEFSQEQLRKAAINSENLEKVIRLLGRNFGPFGWSTNYKFLANDVLNLKASLQRLSVDGQAIENLVALFEKCLLTASEVEARLVGSFPPFEKVRDAWNKTELRQASLTALGKALAHSALTSRCPFQAPLDIWVR